MTALLGLLVLAVAVSPPLDAAADRTLSMHMVQHGLIGMVAAPLLVVGMPVAPLLRALPKATARRVARLYQRLAHPALGALSYIVVLGVVHLPAVYDAAEAHGAVHGVVHAALLWSAVALWLPLRRTSPVAAIAALIAAMAAMTALGVTIGAADHPLYGAYPDLADQHRAGGLMAVGGMIIMLPAFLWLTWRALAAEERRQVAREGRPR